MDRLIRLVFSFYREEHLIKLELDPLLACTSSRSWETVRIDCVDRKHQEQVCELLKYICVPLLLLKLGRNIAFRAPGVIPKTYSLELLFNSDLFTY